MKAQDILNLPRSVWAKIGGEAATKIVKDSDKGYGTREGTNKRYKFPEYKRHSPFWFTKTLKDGTKKSIYAEDYPTRKAAGRAASKGVSTSKQTSPPNLRLTGTMLNSISAQKPTNIGVDIVFRDGLKVKGNADNGRNIFGVNSENEDQILKNLSDVVGKNVNKYAKKPINITIG